MKLLYICWLDSATTDLPLFLAEAWEKAGHEVRLFPYDLEFSNHASSRLKDTLALTNEHIKFQLMEERINESCARYKPDVLLFGHPFIEPEGMARLHRKYGCILGYFIGYNNLMERFVTESMRIADFIIVHDSYLIPLLKGSRYSKVPNVFFLLSSANQHEHRPIPLSDYDQLHYGADVAFIGGAGPNRIEALHSLPECDLRIWGGIEWLKAPSLCRFFRDEPVYGLKKTKIYNATKIVLNIEDDDKQINAFSQRIPEVLACGGFVITEWRKDLELTELVDGESFATYNSLDELNDKVKFYLNHPDERRRISENGRKIVLESLTYDHVAGPIIKQIDDVVLSKGNDN